MGIYYFEDYNWQPGEHTLFYSSLNGNYNAEGTLNPTYNTSSGVTYPTLGSIQYAYISNGLIIWNISASPTDNLTLQAWVKGPAGGAICVGDTQWTTNNNGGIQLYSDGNKRGAAVQNGTTWYRLIDSVNVDSNTWYLITCIKEGTTLYFYKNNILVGSVACANTINSKTKLFLASNVTSPVGYMTMNVSNIILEDTAWTQQQRSDYYNGTKSLYGIS